MDNDAARFQAEVMDELRMRDEMDSIDKLSAAMAKAFPAIEGAVKGKVNPAFRSKYADLSAVIDAIKPHLVEHGLWFVQRTHPVDGGVGVETVILHFSGQSLSCGVLRLPAAKQDAQGYGSALTYCRRYSLMAAFGVPAEDDDGNAAVGRQNGSGGTGAPQDDAEYTAIHNALKTAAKGGTEALMAKFRSTEPGAAKRDVWNDHGAALKTAAEKADKEKAPA